MELQEVHDQQALRVILQQRSANVLNCMDFCVTRIRKERYLAYCIRFHGIVCREKLYFNQSCNSKQIMMPIYYVIDNTQEITFVYKWAK